MNYQLVKKLQFLIKEKKQSVLRNKLAVLHNLILSKSQDVNTTHIISELNQIMKARTITRMHYYLNRLIKGLTETKFGKLNDLNLNRWKEYSDIITDSLWILDKRDRSGVHSAGYWGNFVPQIPHQLLLRYTKKGEWVLDPFLGSGTTLIECKHLGRNGLGVELQSKIARSAYEAITKEKNPYAVKCEVVNEDSTQIDFRKQLNKLKVKSVQFVIVHPPYWDIIKFSKNKDDLSNAKSLEEFLKNLALVIHNCSLVLDKERYLALVIGDKYNNGEWIPLGFYAMQEVMKQGFLLKSIIVKNFKQTKAKRNQEELWRYRALVGGFYVFKHEYIFLFKKK